MEENQLVLADDNNMCQCHSCNISLHLFMWWQDSWNGVKAVWLIVHLQCWCLPMLWVPCGYTHRLGFRCENHREITMCHVIISRAMSVTTLYAEHSTLLISFSHHIVISTVDACHIHARLEPTPHPAGISHQVDAYLQHNTPKLVAILVLSL